MTRLGSLAILLSAFVVIGSTGCCCTTGPCGGYADPYVGCHDTGNCDPCGHCCHPVASTVGRLLSNIFTCGAGCGECYLGPPCGHTGACGDPCGPMGYYGHPRPILNGLKYIFGHPYHCGYEVGCAGCGGGTVTSDCGCHGGGGQMVPMQPVEEVPSAGPATDVPTEARRIYRSEPRSYYTRRASHVSSSPSRRISQTSGRTAQRASHVSPARR